MTFIRPPINYTGSKFRLLPQLLEHLPQGMETLYDYFGGSACLSLNLAEYATAIVYNDRDQNLVNLMEFFRDTPSTEVVPKVKKVIEDWGLGKGEKNNFHEFRDYFNRDTFGNTPEEFLALIYHSFSSNIRYNRAGDRITSSSGGSEAFFRESHGPRLIEASENFKKIPVTFTCHDLFEIDFDEPQEYDFVILDPPYLASGETMYNHFWSEEHEKYLLEKLDELHSRGVRFALSNVLYSKGHTNQVLIDWANKYTTIDLTMSYKNSSHQVHEGKSLPTREVLIINY